jgi:hypothetical protein
MARTPQRSPWGIQNVDYSASPLGTVGEANYSGARQSHPLFMYPALDPFRLIIEQDDFLTFPATGSYTTTVVGTGTASVVVGVGGILQLNTSATSGDSVSYQNSTADTAFTSSLQGWYHCLITPQDSTNSEILIGLTNSTTTPLTATDGFYFHKASGSQNVDLVLVNAGVTTTIAAITTMADLTAIKLSLYYNGKGELAYYVNNSKISSTTNTAAFPLSSVTLASTFYIKTAAAAAKYLNVDYFLVALESNR